MRYKYSPFTKTKQLSLPCWWCIPPHSSLEAFFCLLACKNEEQWFAPPRLPFALFLLTIGRKSTSMWRTSRMYKGVRYAWSCWLTFFLLSKCSFPTPLDEMPPRLWIRWPWTSESTLHPDTPGSWLSNRQHSFLRMCTWNVLKVSWHQFRMVSSPSYIVTKVYSWMLNERVGHTGIEDSLLDKWMNWKSQSTNCMHFFTLITLAFLQLWDVALLNDADFKKAADLSSLSPAQAACHWTDKTFWYI